MKTDNQIAKEILTQLGGSRFVAMTGAACFSDTNSLVVKFKGSNIANHMTVKLNALDLYDVTISKFRGLKINIVKEFNNVYADNLRTIFESTTKLHTSL